VGWGGVEKLLSKQNAKFAKLTCRERERASARESSMCYYFDVVYSTGGLTPQLQTLPDVPSPVG